MVCDKEGSHIHRQHQEIITLSEYLLSKECLAIMFFSAVRARWRISWSSCNARPTSLRSMPIRKCLRQKSSVKVYSGMSLSKSTKNTCLIAYIYEDNKRSKVLYADWYYYTNIIPATKLKEELYPLRVFFLISPLTFFIGFSLNKHTHILSESSVVLP